MSIVSTEELFAGVDGGSVYIKKWIPENPKFSRPIVLMHDSLGCVDLWRDFPERLARSLSRIVIAYDRLGFGQSSENKKAPTVHFIWDEADYYFPSVKRAAQFNEYYLFGHSVGGAMSIGIAAVDKECLGVITESAQSFVEDKTTKGIREAQTMFQHPKQMERLVKWHGNKARWVLKAWFDIWLSSEFASWSLKPRIGQIICPVLAIHGDKDEYGSNAFPEFIAKNVSGESKIIILENCGHVPHKEMMAAVIHQTSLFFEHYCVA